MNDKTRVRYGYDTGNDRPNLRTDSLHSHTYLSWNRTLFTPDTSQGFYPWTTESCDVLIQIYRWKKVTIIIDLSTSTCRWCKGYLPCLRWRRSRIDSRCRPIKFDLGIFFALYLGYRKMIRYSFNFLYF